MAWPLHAGLTHERFRDLCSYNQLPPGHLDFDIAQAWFEYPVHRSHSHAPQVPVYPCKFASPSSVNPLQLLSLPSHTSMAPGILYYPHHYNHCDWIHKSPAEYRQMLYPGYFQNRHDPDHDTRSWVVLRSGTGLMIDRFEFTRTITIWDHLSIYIFTGYCARLHAIATFNGAELKGPVTE